jgi:hypothetical protein
MVQSLLGFEVVLMLLLEWLEEDKKTNDGININFGLLSLVAAQDAWETW